MTRFVLFFGAALTSCTGPGVTGTDGDSDIGDSDRSTDDTDAAPERTELPRIADLEDLDPSDGEVRIRLVAAPHSTEVGGERVDGFAYNGQIPGPTLRLTRGDRVTAEIVNDLDVPTTVHWHGLHVPNAADGAIWMREPIGPGETATVVFTVEQAGTFWYHPHFDTDRQVDLGLYGAVVVADPDEPQLDEDIVIIGDAWGESSEDVEHGTPGNMGTWTFNGVSDPVLTLASGTATRLRWVNASNEGYLDLRPPPEWSWIASDQGLVSPRSGRELLAPGDRADVELRAGADPQEVRVVPYSLFGGVADEEGAATAVGVGVTGDAAVPPTADWGVVDTEPTADPGRTDLRFVFQGDGARWFMNGEVFPDITVPEVRLGEELILEVRNVSPTEHPFHIHGHAFEVLSIDGEPPRSMTLEDTINVGIRQTLRLRMVADNPGEWMVHCHILGHAEGGMMTVLRVAE